MPFVRHRRDEIALAWGEANDNTAAVGFYSSSWPISAKTRRALTNWQKRVTRAVADAVRIEYVQGIDLGENYIDFARSLSSDGPRIVYKVGDACALPFEDAAFDRTMASLVLNFVPDGPRAVAEMARVTRPGAMVGAAVWDLRGGMSTARLLWDTASVLDPEAA